MEYPRRPALLSSTSRHRDNRCCGRRSLTPWALSPELTSGGPSFGGWSLALGAVFVTGALHIQARGASTPLDTAIQPYADRQELQIAAHVTRDGRLQHGGFNEIRQTIDVETEEVQTAAGRSEAIHSGIRLSIYSSRSNDATQEEDSGANTIPSTASMPVFHYGDRIRFSAKLKMPRNFRNPGAFDYRGYLADPNIAALGSTKIEDVERLPGFAASRIAYWRSRLHRGIIAKVHELWPPREAALIAAMVIGEEAFIDRDTRADFQRSGTYHVLVVSGMNVSILAFAVFWMLRRLRLSDVPATLLTVSFCVAYAFTTEVGAPVWRATLMCAIYLGTRLLYRDRAMVNALGAAALGLLVFDPRQLLTASFQMTFVCVLIVAAIGIPILQRTSQLQKHALATWDSRHYAALLPPRVAQFRVDLQFIAARGAPFVGEKWSRRLVRGSATFCLAAGELLFISAVMQMGLALPMAYYFHRATTIGLPSNVIVVPLTQLMMPAAVAALALGYVSPWLAKIPVLLTTFALRRDHWDGPRPGSPASGRPARSPAVHSGDCASRSCAGGGDVGSAPAPGRRNRRTCSHPRSLFRSRIHPTGAANASRSAGGDFD